MCAYWACAGWLLSAAHELNRTGYALALGASVVLFWFWRRHAGKSRRKFGGWLGHTIRRFRRPFPAGFAVLSLLAAAGGAIHPPGNYDGLAYRTPRVLNWLAEGHWHWIPTEFNRLNNRACDFEWLTAPLISLTGSDRLEFLINFISFILLPGLIFSVFWRLGVSRKTAWHWMWLAPTGYCFLLQAGGIGNDMFALPFALAAVDCALRARASSRVVEVWISILSAALLTGSKANNLPLLLPWLVAILPCLKLLRLRLVGTAAICAIAALTSFLPTAVLNLKYCGDWSGLAAEHNEVFQARPLLRVANNTALLTIQNLAPPVFPIASAWNHAVERVMPPGFRKALEANFEPGAAHWTLGELEIEEGAGLGLGVTGLALVSLAAGLLRSGRGLAGRPSSFAGDRWPISIAILVSAWVALLALMAKSGITAISRAAAAYYPLCLAGPLYGFGFSSVVAKRWWKLLGIAVFALGAVVIILSPARPLWPWRLVLGSAANDHSLSLWSRAASVYEVQSRRADAFAPVRELLPPNLSLLGLISFDDPETSLWRPFGSRRILHVTRTDSKSALRARGIEYILVNQSKFDFIFQQPFEQWLAGIDGEKTAELTLSLRSSLGPSRWALVKLRSNGL
jgi:hypothetical protein